MKLGENIRLYRTKAGLTQEQLGEKVGVSSQAVSKWESDASLPDTALLPEIAKALFTTIDGLFGFEQTTKESMLEHLYRYQASRPTDQQSRTACAWEMLFHTFTSALWRGSPEDIPSLSDATQSVQMSWDECLTQGWYYPDTRLFLMLPRPEKGWEAAFPEDEDVAKLFGYLGNEDVLKAVRWLFTKHHGYSFLFPVLLRDAGIAPEKEAYVKEALFHLRLLVEKPLLLDGVPEKMYLYHPHHAIMALWVLAYNYLHNDYGYNWQQMNLTEPFFSTTKE